MKQDKNAEPSQEDIESREIVKKVRKQNRNHIRQKLTIIPSQIQTNNHGTQAESMPYSLTQTHKAQSNSMVKVLKDFD